MPTKREVVGLWPRFWATIRLLCHRSWEYIYVISQEATTLIFFAVTSRGCQLEDASYYDVALRAMTHDNLIFMLYRDERTTTIHFSSYRMRERASDDHVVTRRASQCTSYRDEQTILLSFAREATYFTRCIARSDGDEHILVFLRHKPLVREHVSHRKDEMTNSFFRSIARERAT